MTTSELEETWDDSTEQLRQTMIVFAELQTKDLRERWIAILKIRFGENYDRPRVEKIPKTPEPQRTQASDADDQLSLKNSMVPLGNFVEHLVSVSAQEVQTLEKLVEQDLGLLPFRNSIKHVLYEPSHKISCDSWVSKPTRSRQSQFRKWISVNKQFHRARFKRGGNNVNPVKETQHTKAQRSLIIQSNYMVMRPRSTKKIYRVRKRSMDWIKYAKAKEQVCLSSKYNGKFGYGIRLQDLINSCSHDVTMVMNVKRDLMGHNRFTKDDGEMNHDASSLEKFVEQVVGLQSQEASREAGTKGPRATPNRRNRRIPVKRSYRKARKRRFPKFKKLKSLKVSSILQTRTSPRYNINRVVINQGWEQGSRVNFENDGLSLLKLTVGQGNQCDLGVAYDEFGSLPAISVNTTLQFDVELLTWVSVKDNCNYVGVCNMIFAVERFHLLRPPELPSNEDVFWLWSSSKLWKLNRSEFQGKKLLVRYVRSLLSNGKNMKLQFKSVKSMWGWIYDKGKMKLRNNDEIYTNGKTDQLQDVREEMRFCGCRFQMEQKLLYNKDCLVLLLRSPFSPKDFDQFHSRIYEFFWKVMRDVKETILNWIYLKWWPYLQGSTAPTKDESGTEAEWLVQWTCLISEQRNAFGGLLVLESTWEPLTSLVCQFPDFYLEDKVSLLGGSIDRLRIMMNCMKKKVITKGKNVITNMKVQGKKLVESG